MLSFTHYAKPWSLNDERSSHWRVHRKRTDVWRKAFAALGSAVAAGNPLALVIVTVVPEWKNRAHFPDVGACVGAAKAAIDGLVDAGILAADDPTVVRELRFKAPRVTGRYALTVRVTPYREGVAWDEADQ